jgi:hypothetical protein
VPIFWDQKGTFEEITVTRDSAQTREAFNIHFEDILSDYYKITCIDLLSDSKAREIKLTKEYIKQFYESPIDKTDTLKMVHFDFHHFCKGDKYKSLKVLLGKVSA